MQQQFLRVKKCLCHKDFSCNHLLLDGNNRLTGIIDFGDSGNDRLIL